jgi:hypothetical protein
MLEQFRRRLHRAMPFDTARHLFTTAPASIQDQVQGEVSPRKLRRIAATRNFKSTSADTEMEAKVRQQPQMSPRTPEYMKPVRKEHDLEEVLKGTLSSDGGSVRLLSGVVMDVSNAS